MVEGVDGHGAAEGISEEGAGVEGFAVRGGPCVHDFGFSDTGGEGEAAGEGFAEADEVRDDGGVFAGEEGAGAEESGVDFVEDEKGVVGIAPGAEF